MSDQPEVLVNLPPRERGGVLALDLATVSGWAYGSPNPKEGPAGGSFECAGKTRSAIFAAAYTAISDLCSVYRPSLIVNEKAMPVAVQEMDKRTGRMKVRVLISNDDAISQLRGLIATAEVVSAHYETHIIEYARMTYFNSVTHGFPIIWKKKNGQDAKDTKAMAIRWCNACGYQVVDDNEADARMLLEYTLRTHRGRGYV